MKEKFQAELDKLKTLTFKKKIEYIWEYYKIPIIAVVFAVIIIVSFARTLAAVNKDAITFVATDVLCEDSDITSRVLNDAFTKHMGDEADEKDMIVLDASMYFKNNDEYTASVMIQKLTAMVSSHSANIFIGSNDFVQTQGAFGMFENLEEKLDPQIYEALKNNDMLISVTIPEDTESSEPSPEYTYYAGVDMSKLDNELLDSAGMTLPESAILAIPVNGNNEDRAIEFFYLLLDEAYRPN